VVTDQDGSFHRSRWHNGGLTDKSVHQKNGEQEKRQTLASFAQPAWLALKSDRDGNCSGEQIEVAAAVEVGAAILGLRLGSKMRGKLNQSYSALPQLQ